MNFLMLQPARGFLFLFFGNYMQNSAALRNNGREFFEVATHKSVFA